MNFSKLQRLYVFSFSFLFLSVTVSYSQSEKLLNEIRKEDVKADASSDQDAIGKLEKHLNAKDVHYFKMGNLAKVHKNGLFSFNSPLTGKIIHAMSTRIEYQSDKDFYWYGTVSDSSFKGDLMLISQAGKIFGQLNYGNEYYSIYGIGNSISAFVPSIGSNTRSKFCPDPPPAELITRTSTKINSPNTIEGACQNTNRILVLYSQNAYNSDPNISQTASTAVAQFNQALFNTGIYNVDAALVLAGAQLLSNFSESQQFQPDVNINNDVNIIAASSTVNTYRNAVKADIVVLLTNSQGYYGGYYGQTKQNEATVSNAFAVVEAAHATSGNENVFAHEVGHIFGGLHENDYTSTPIRYAHAYDFIGKDDYGILDVSYITLMHNPDGASTRLLQFSSSVVTYQNRATGDATDHDVARRINERAYTVSRFLDPAGTLTGTINGISYISSSGYYSYSSDISCGITPYTYQWAVSSDGWNYTNVSTYPSTSIGIYPGSAYVQSGSLYWRLNIHSADGQNQSLFKYVGVNQSIHLRGGDVSAIANNHYDGFVLTSATPNPVTDQATIEFQVPEKHEIKLELFNEVGQSIKVLEAGEFEAGIYRHKLNTNFLAGGTYMYRLSSGEFSAIKKLTVIK